MLKRGTDMTKAQEVYLSTLNLLGTGVLAGELQDVVDREHAAADPIFETELQKRHRERAKQHTVQRLIVL